MKALLEETVFSVGHADYRWDDVVLAAQVWGDWDRIRKRARAGVAFLSALEEQEDDRVSDDEMESAAEEFRYARDLISAEEMEDWLGRWGLTAETWMDWVRVSVLRQKRSGTKRRSWLKNRSRASSSRRRFARESSNGWPASSPGGRPSPAAENRARPAGTGSSASTDPFEPSESAR
jgi:hypothetical protein